LRDTSVLLVCPLVLGLPIREVRALLGERIRRGARPLDQLRLHLGGYVGQPPSARGPQAALRVAVGNDVRTLCPPTTGGSAAELLAPLGLEANASCDNGVRPFPR
jgi:hypothetical protein